MFTSVAGRSVVVTGASRGIGLGVAKVFADSCANVLICGRDEQAMRDALDSLHEAPGQIDTAMVDVTDRLSCGDMAAYARKQFGDIDVLCANAGIFPSVRVEDGQTLVVDGGQVLPESLQALQEM